jgi:hypothetical protein
LFTGNKPCLVLLPFLVSLARYFVGCDPFSPEEVMAVGALNQRFRHRGVAVVGVQAADVGGYRFDLNHRRPDDYRLPAIGIPRKIKTTVQG